MKKESDALTIVILKPKTLFYAWIAENISTSEDKKSVDIEDIATDNTVIMVPFNHASDEFTIFWSAHLEEILIREFSRWSSNEALWPSRCDQEVLSQYFDLEIHSTVVDYSIG